MLSTVEDHGARTVLQDYLSRIETLEKKLTERGEVAYRDDKTFRITSALAGDGVVGARHGCHRRGFVTSLMVTFTTKAAAVTAGTVEFEVRVNNRESGMSVVYALDGTEDSSVIDIPIVTRHPGTAKFLAGDYLTLYATFTTTTAANVVAVDASIERNYPKGV